MAASDPGIGGHMRICIRLQLYTESPYTASGWTIRWEEHQLTASNAKCGLAQETHTAGALVLWCSFHLKASKYLAYKYRTCLSKVIMLDDVQVHHPKFDYFDYLYPVRDLVDEKCSLIDEEHYALSGLITIPTEHITKPWCARYWPIAKCLIEHVRTRAAQRAWVQIILCGKARQDAELVVNNRMLSQQRATRGHDR